MMESTLNHFPLTNGVKQGCVMAPTLFSIMFSAMLTDAFQDVDAGFPIRYRFDGKLLNLRRLQTKSKVQTDVVDKLLNAYDLAENAKSEGKMQGVVNLMSKECDNFQLIISTKRLRWYTSQHLESSIANQSSL